MEARSQAFDPVREGCGRFEPLQYTMRKRNAEPAEVLTFLRTYHEANGRMPSTREIQAQFGLKSQTGAVNYLRRLEQKGAIRRAKYEGRAIEILA
jgi:SOS-response transcriptional repressor LexA